MGRSVAILGTGSSVGKTLITMSLCYYYGYEKQMLVSPFKAFNLSGESFELDGKTIGNAQYIQSIASNKLYNCKMNPILKQYDNNKMKNIVLGDEVDKLDICEMKEIVNRSYDDIQKENDIIIIEGSGSFLELNIDDLDVPNLMLVKEKKIPIIIVCDISNGGVFGNLYGHINLLGEQTRKLVKGIIINKFDGEPKFFETGKEILEKICKVPILGIIPKIENTLPEEDVKHVYKDKCLNLEDEIKKVSREIIKHMEMELITNIISK